MHVYFFAVVVPEVVSQPALTSSVQQVCPGGVIVFTCTTNGSSTLAWRSEEYIGSSSQFEFRSIDPIGILRTSTSNPETIANLTAIQNTNGLLILTSTLRIATRSTPPNVSVSCFNSGGRATTLTISPASM